MIALGFRLMIRRFRLGLIGIFYTKMSPICALLIRGKVVS